MKADELSKIVNAATVLKMVDFRYQDQQPLGEIDYGRVVAAYNGLRGILHDQSTKATEKADSATLALEQATLTREQLELWNEPGAIPQRNEQEQLPSGAVQGELGEDKPKKPRRLKKPVEEAVKPGELSHAATLLQNIVKAPSSIEDQVRSAVADSLEAGLPRGKVIELLQERYNLTELEAARAWSEQASAEVNSTEAA